VLDKTVHCNHKKQRKKTFSETYSFKTRANRCCFCSKKIKMATKKNWKL